MDKLMELKRQYHEKLDAAEAAVNDERRHKALVAEARAVQVQILELEENERRGGRHVGPGSVVGPGAFAQPESTDQSEIRMLRHGEPMAPHVPQDLPDGIKLSELSVGRVVRAIIRGSWKGAEAEQRAMQGQESSLGGHFLPSPLSAQLIDLARARMVTSAAGAITIPVEADSLKVPKHLTDPTVTWRGELEPIVESDPTCGAVTLYPKVAGVLVKISHELAEDGLGVGSYVERVMAQALAQEKDRVAMLGSGQQNQPLGIFGTPGVGEVIMGAPAPDGAAFADYDPFLEAILACENANGSPSAVIYAPRSKAELAMLTTGIAGDLTKLTPPVDFAGLRKFTTTAVPIDQEHGMAVNASCAFVGGFENVWIGLRSSVRIDASIHGPNIFNRLAVWIRAFIRMDVAVVRPDQLCVVRGIIPV